MENTYWIKKSTYISTIIILLLIFAITLFFVITYYEKRKVNVSVPTVVENINTDNSMFGMSITN